MIIVPAIDLYEGKCVRLAQGDFDKMTIYPHSPLQFAQEIEGAGFTHLHLVDLEGAKNGAPQNLSILEEIASKTTLTIDFGGGLSDTAALQSAINAGAHDLCVGTVAVTDPPLFTDWLDEFGSHRILIAADVRDEEIAVKGWQEGSGVIIQNALPLWIGQGATRILCTDIARDGMMHGPATELYTTLLAQFPQIKIWASGGIRSYEDLQTLTESGCVAAVVGKAFHDRTLSLSTSARLAAHAH